MMKVRVLCDGGKELGVFKNRGIALEWIVSNKYMLISEEMCLRTLVIVVE